MDDRKNLLSGFIEDNIIEIPSVLNEYLSGNNGTFYKRNEFEEIKRFVEDFINGKRNNRFILLPGIRGVGKTTIMFQIYEYLIKEKNIPLKQILYFSCDDVNDFTECSIREIADIFLEDVHDTTMRLIDKKIFILINESQYDKHWPISTKIIFDRTKNIFLIVSGSSAISLEENGDVTKRSEKIDILPLTYSHHLKLEHNIKIENNNSLLKAILTGNINEIKDKEEEINNLLINDLNYTPNDWKKYLFYGGFPIYFEEEDTTIIRNDINKMTKKVVSEDIPNMKNISENNKTFANRVLRYLALQESSDVSMNKIAKNIKTSVGNIETILKLIEKTHLIFHLEPYGTVSFKKRKPFKYYFATSSLKYALSSKSGQNIRNKKQYEGILIENLIASKIYELIRSEDNITLLYDAKKGNVDFILSEEFSNPIPIEVGRGKKDKKQIKNAIKNYKADFGIIISETTKKIIKEDDIIYIPIKTFALL